MIDLIIPFYNSEKFIKNTIDSIKQQSFQDFKCYLINDNSTDASLNVILDSIQNDSRFKVFDKPRNIPQGAGYARQFGFAISSNDFICWFDSDDIMFPDHLEKKVSVLLANEEIEYVVCSQTRLNSVTNSLGSTSNIIDINGNNILGYFLGEYSYFVHPLWRRKSILKSKLVWNNGYLDDWDFNMQAISKSMKCMKINIPLLYYVSRTGSYQNLRNSFQYSVFLDEFRFRYKWLKFIKVYDNKNYLFLKKWCLNSLLKTLRNKNSLKLKFKIFSVFIKFIFV